MPPWAYDKAAIKCNGKEAITNFEASTYEGEISFDTNNPDGSTAQNLDLNLWISAPTDVPKGNDNVRNFQSQYAACEMPDGKRPRVETSVSSPIDGRNIQGLTMASKNSSVWSGHHPSFTPNYEDIAGTLATEEAEDSAQLAKLRSALESVDHKRRKVYILVQETTFLVLF
ncbi:APETALA2-like protein 1 [Camellia lanceoleosa]|uniref:APETALA2-like protein 1 n=1 Tax=Camellia lanceoleosa TaxID=1840588 RepID=A0ACC0FZ29_9ERIC|nr:APETALA2-like protein 1 [Camellia lanceoleosa]